ncbi:ubiquitin carboxyl-terminal hydrolase family protein [Cryptosporidium muris RN66]|uniref:ubiquitinyl hydrolase 1 n=1 Tax=Cryptosporidium muris (strain RN66) TaxID=441375 RepID=B6AFW9_CRYMR|nr:ubiquitin carboxyl-terminal hydrolase family protein [Cryptosporidium muris RN66]EEA07110.1 ubiquitin carboxyl-terminal hydrolase family protein [Cryptosporidium muris RN66]|eukprot:XP_002141459.1 ubiquitin carboxyl-terminal hydrolase family protein [Cryptosporidium muris RN66]
MRDSIKVVVKWNSSIFNDIELSLVDSVEVFKHQLWTLTGVPPERQKLMSPCGLLKDNSNLSKLGLKDGAKIMLVGTSEGNELRAPTNQTVFFEDLTVEERAKILHQEQIMPLPVGLANLGNTCYLNSIIHMLRSVPNFLEQLKNSNFLQYSSTDTQRFLDTLRSLMIEMDGSSESVIPTHFIDLFRRQFPQFSTRSGPLGVYQQQDAEEVLGCLITLLNNELTSKDSNGLTFKDLFRFSIVSRLKNVEVESEGEIKNEDHYKLVCHMGTQLSPVDHLAQGIRVSMDETIEKFSASLGSNSIYHKLSEINSLPHYLIVHLVRFEWKKSSEIARTEATRAKVCRKIQFSQILDLFEFCSPELKQSLKVSRDIFDSRGETLQREIAESNTNVNIAEYPTGFYELECTVTHQGRTADSGHYVAWRHCYDDPEYLIKFDDDKVTKVRVKDTDLSGGRSDYHIAVLLLYKRKTIKVSKEEINSSN